MNAVESGYERCESLHQTHEIDNEPTVIVHRVTPEGLNIGVQFGNEDEVYDYYNSHAISKGFSVRKHVTRRNKDGKITTRTLVCSKEGISNAQSEHSLSVRTGCKTFARFKESCGVWALIDFHDEHNNEMATEDEKHLLRSGRKISDADKKIISSMAKAGFGATQTFQYLADEYGGETNVTFTLEDLNNHIRTKRMVQKDDSIIKQSKALITRKS